MCVYILYVYECVCIRETVNFRWLYCVNVTFIDSVQHYISDVGVNQNKKKLITLNNPIEYFRNYIKIHVFCNTF